MTISKREIEESSNEAAVWITGFLHGNEPAPPHESKDSTGGALEATRDMWRERLREFHETGIWPDGASDDPPADPS